MHIIYMWRLYCYCLFLTSFLFIVLGFNDTSTLVGHFVSSPGEREKRERRDIRGNKREGQGRKRKMNENEETEVRKTFPLHPYLLQGLQALPNCEPISVGHPNDARYTTLFGVVGWGKGVAHLSFFCYFWKGCASWLQHFLGIFT